jgi:hypothetical protein
MDGSAGTLRPVCTPIYSDGFWLYFVQYLYSRLTLYRYEPNPTTPH